MTNANFNIIMFVGRFLRIYFTEGVAMSKIKELLVKYKELILYAIVGFLTTVISFGAQYIFEDLLLLHTSISTAIAWFISVLFAFVASKLFVFEKTSLEKRSWAVEMLLFFGSRAGTGLMEVASMTIFVGFCGFNNWIVKIITTVVLLVLNYILSKFLVFRKRKKKDAPSSEELEMDADPSVLCEEKPENENN